jgi:hypothetical protein
LVENPVPLCPPEVSHGMAWDWTQASSVTGQSLTAWAIAWARYVLDKGVMKRETSSRYQQYSVPMKFHGNPPTGSRTYY